MSNAILLVVITPAFYTVQQLYLEHKIWLIHILNIASSARPSNQSIFASYKDLEFEIKFYFDFLERAMFWIWIL